MPIAIHKKTFWILIGVAVICLYPFQSTIVSSQTVLVLTDDGHPIQAASVRQIWQDYSLERTSHEEDLKTGQDGRVTFPHRYIRACLAKRTTYVLWVFAREGVHASFGMHTDMFLVGSAGHYQVGRDIVKAQTGDVVFRVPTPPLEPGE